jgi:uncharacterized protein (DUF362 family)
MKSVVAVLKTTPESVLEDYARLLSLARYEEHLPKKSETLLKINISWHHFYPGCSTMPWQLDGVVKKMLADGYSASSLIGAHNKTVVVDDRLGEVSNKHKAVTDKHGVKVVHLNDDDVAWSVYEPKGRFRVLDKIYPEGVLIPCMFHGKNVIQLPTMKTHVFTTTTGAMKNAFGGLLNTKRHWTHACIHETLVDLLMIQKEIRSGVFAVMDGTVAGDGPGPRAMRPHVKNYILASADLVAIDAVAAKMMGFDPMSLKYIRMAHEDGLGCGDVREIEIAGEDIRGVNFHFNGSEDTFASRGQKLIYHGPLKPLESLLLRTPIVPWAFAASRIYHDLYWYNFVGRRRVRKFMKTGWGRLFESY